MSVDPDPIFADPRLAAICDALDAAEASLEVATAKAGRLVFEARDPSQRAWEEWHREASFTRTTIPGVGSVESRVELTDVAMPMPFVSFRWTYRFESDDAIVTSDSTLRFRERHEIVGSLATSGFDRVI